VGTYIEEVGEITLRELLPKAWKYIHTTWAKFIFYFFWGIDHWALPQIGGKSGN